PRASTVQDAAKRHRRLAPARSVLDSCEHGAMLSAGRVAFIIADAGGVTAPPRFLLPMGRKSKVPAMRILN
ncbi:hypothetical protein, partial [Bradyrhizobium sp.]|uniref:hypothetical protein n=1 Tax=Bradyrhizobium sp. TaxID=376 RepID=UPI0025BF8D1D